MGLLFIDGILCHTWAAHLVVVATVKYLVLHWSTMAEWLLETLWHSGGTQRDWVAAVESNNLGESLFLLPFLLWFNLSTSFHTLMRTGLEQ